MSRIVAALGGNAIIKKGETGTITQQFNNTFDSMGFIANLIKNGHQVVLTHGNGPQVGFIMVQVEAAAGKVPYVPLNVDVAQSQGSMGYMIAQSLTNQLRKLSIECKVAAVMTQVQIDRHDPAMKHPIKPVGSFHSKEQAVELERSGHVMIEDSGRGWRRVVPSPGPIRIIETGIIKDLIQDGVIVVACGGGGIPVVEEKGKLKGVDAVIDKDLVSSLLAIEIKADVVMFLTTVERVYLNFNTPKQEELIRLTPGEASRYLAEGHFAPGSMGPKIKAAVEFVENGGIRAVICRPEDVVEAVASRAGTVIE